MFKKLFSSFTLTALLFTTNAVLIPLQAHAATPVVNTTIAVEKTGSEPFDPTTWDGSDLGTAGFDEDEDNNVTRLQDSITYKVEISVNDADVDELTATVQLDKKQSWIEIPTGCKGSPDVTNVSTISADGRTLFCNTGQAIEGTNKVVYPAARAIGASYDGTEITINDDTVNASVDAQADGISNTASDISEDTVVTANFRLNTVKELKVTATDPDTGEPLYIAPRKVGPDPDNRLGSIIEFVVKARYLNGSMIADSDEVSFEEDYQIVDIYTDDNNNNNGAFSTGGVLYDWDPATPPCSLVGDHGPNAAISCSQLNAAIDDIGAGGAAPDTIDDPNIQIDLTDIDVRDPDNDSNLFEFQLNIWFDRSDDLNTHQVCAGGGACINTVTNRVGTINGSTIEGFNPVSTEDAGGNNLDNYNGTGEPFPNEESYPLFYASIGSWSTHTAFTDIFPHATDKYPDQNMSAGETRPFIMNVYEYRKIDGAESQLCNKIDTQVFEYAGIAPPFQTPTPSLYPWNHNEAYNPIFTTFGGAVGSMRGDAQSLVDFYFSNTQYIADPITDQSGYLTELRTAECNDDVNGDGSVVIMDASGALVDEDGNPTTGAIDWWRDASMVEPIGGGVGNPSNVTRVRQNMFYDAALTNAQDPTHTQFGIAVNHLITAKSITASPYGSDNRLPHFMSSRRDSADGVFSAWGHADVIYEDPSADANFSIAARFADRMTLVPSNHAIAKRTDPAGLKVVRGGDTVDFIIQPTVIGLWNNTINTATVNDNLPVGTDYVNGSEQFSTDGGTTWMDRPTYDASTPDITITSAGHAGGDDPLIWDFGSVDAGEQLPLIKYSVSIDPERTSGTFTNTATITSDIGADQDGDGNSDDASATYQLTILPEFGFDVLKVNADTVYETNTPFTMDLIYKNLGGENYSGGDFIDIFPYQDDGNGIISSGLASTRTPSSDYTGILNLTGITAGNSETFYATDADPTTIPQDPCHSDNQPSGYVPVDGDLCYTQYIDNFNRFTDGATTGQGIITWNACTAADPTTCTIPQEDITALRFTTPAIPTTAGGQTVTLEFTPAGNVGGTPSLDADGEVTAASTGDIYTNTFGGRIPEVSLVVISNDVSVTVVSGSVGNYVWLDTNQDGIQDANELPLPNVTVNLLDGSGDPVYWDPNTGAIVDQTDPNATPYSVQTDADGAYIFENLPSGDYQVQVDTSTLPAGSVQTYDADGAGDHTSAHTLTQETDAFGNLTSVEDNDEQDFGYYYNFDLALKKEVTSEGPYYPGDNITYAITIYNQGTVDATDITITDQLPTGLTLNDSSWTDIGNNQSTYTVASLPAGQEIAIPFTATINPDATGDLINVAEISDAKDGDGNDVTDIDSTPDTDPDNDTQEDDTTDNSNGDEDDNDPSGITISAPLGSIGNYVWIDTNEDGIQDADEQPLANVTVTLTLPDGTTQTTQTDANGQYLFSDLPPGDYIITITPPEGYTQTYDYDGGGDLTSTYTLGSGENNEEQDFGLAPPSGFTGEIGNRIYYDANQNCEHDPDEGIEDVTVELTWAGPDNEFGTDDDQEWETKTDKHGEYLFTNLPPGKYKVEVDEDDKDLDGYTLFSDPDQKCSENHNRANGIDQINLTLGETYYDADFGYIKDEEKEELVKTGTNMPLYALGAFIATLMATAIHMRRRKLQRQEM